MGKLEQISKRKRRNKNFQQLVLKTVAVAGILSVGLLAPNVLGALSKLGLVKRPTFKNNLANSRRRLIQAGLITFQGKHLSITAKGQAKLRQLELRHYQIKKPRCWDGRWRVLIFDISEKRKKLRDKVRLTLIMVGFIRLQDSVWVYPYDCEDLVTLLKTDFRIGRELLYLIVDTIENDRHLRQHFGLA